MAGTSLYKDDDDGGVISDINVTPLVDIMLVLLIIFMVTARLIVNRAIPVKTPKAVSGQEVKTTLALTLQVQPDQSRLLFLNGAPADDRNKVSEYVRKAVAANADIQAVITADTVVPHGEVIDLIDLVKLAGVTNFALTVDKKEAGP